MLSEGKIGQKVLDIIIICTCNAAVYVLLRAVESGSFLSVLELLNKSEVRHERSERKG